MNGETIHDLSWAAPSRFSRTLLAPKLFKILYGAGYTALIPFLPMYFRFLGLTAFQSGVLGCLRSLVSCWSSFLWCVLSEKLAKRKCFLVTLLLAGIIFNISISFVHVPEANFMDYTCPQQQVQLNITTSNENASLVARSNAMGEKSKIVYLDQSANSRSLRDTMLIVNTTTHLYDSELETIRTKDKHGRGKSSMYALFGFRLDVLFRNLLLITALAELLMSPVKLICESIFADFTHFSKKSTGKSKTWDYLGDLFGAGIVILIIGRYHCSFALTNSFYLHFYLFAFLSAGAFVFASLMHVYEPKTSMNYRFGRTCKFLCCNMQALSILSIMFVLGALESLMSNFMMWYLQDINASIIVMGLMIVVGTFSELLMLYLSKYVLYWFGHTWVFAVALLAYGAHFLCFSYIRNQWMVLPVQLLQGVTMTCLWSACSAFTAEIAPIGMERTLNGVMSMAYWGFGHGVGGIGVALLYYQYGPMVVFRCAAGVCVVFCLLFVLLQCMLKIPDIKSHLNEYQQLTYRERHHHMRQDDWLLEALEAEDEDTHYSR